MVIKILHLYLHLELVKVFVYKYSQIVFDPKLSRILCHLFTSKSTAEGRKESTIYLVQPSVGKEAILTPLCLTPLFDTFYLTYYLGDQKVLIEC